MLKIYDLSLYIFNFLYGEDHTKCTPFPDFRFYLYHPSGGFHDFFTNIEAESSSYDAFPEVIVYLSEFLKDCLPLLFRDAHSGISDSDTDFMGIAHF